ncbi:hypothetical protein C499_12510 [Halogeometricum borinquense DSM 11551]|uniref:Uncharacterized protein n=2 Tax=Halogeometricum borinquense TaxID=60847 RepID=E4NWH3_HALBP|nr:hypothetical protein [Halogeometricum borinquense]ADQ69393.1 hypothetical protein Hbor_36870 [Halogeometricum borinquense DSM 11551]ELY26061.1 hypothetical protein C499_12510 [Halogeometricum borinquense DSM 11551]RYJ19433.1 hypothetical protein ELS19_00010 [Halogeometricum borinquense]
MKALRTVAGLAGIVVVAVTIGLVAGVVTPVSALSERVSSLDGEQYLLALAAVLLLGGLWFARRRASSTSDRFTELREMPPEGASAPASIRVGGRFDRVVGNALSSDDDDAMTPVVTRLRETATGLYADVANVDQQTARRCIRNGEWTDDELAAAFLAAGSGQAPLRSRIRVWLDPPRERRRRVDATLDALFELREGVVPASEDSERLAERESETLRESEDSAGREPETSGTDEGEVESIAPDETDHASATKVDAGGEQ